MADPDIVSGDLLVRGTLTAVKGFIAPSSSISGTALNPAVLAPANRMQHAHRAGYAQGSGSNAAAATQVIHVTVGTTGSVQAVRAGCVVVAIGAATATVDIKKNGSSILSGVITLNSSNSVRVPVNGTITVPALAAGDVLEIIVTAAAGGGTLAQGIFASVDIFEDPS